MYMYNLIRRHNTKTGPAHGVAKGPRPGLMAPMGSGQGHVMGLGPCHGPGP